VHGSVVASVLFLVSQQKAAKPINSTFVFTDDQPTKMNRNDSSNSINNQAKKKRRPSFLSDVRIDKPGIFDVICGRGRPYQEHPGNIRLHAIVAGHRPRYFSSKRNNKKGIAEMIVNSIKNDETQPGRFLKRVDDENDMVWEDVSDEVAREKVSHVLRFKYKHSEPLSESGASGIPGVNNQSSMQGLQSNLATGQPTLESRQHSLDVSGNLRILSRFALPIASSRYAIPAMQPSRSSGVNAQHALLNGQLHVGGFDTLCWATAGTSSISGVPPGTVGPDGAQKNVSTTSPAKLLSDEQVFLLEALIQTRRARTNTLGIAPSLRFP
jgi:hypothetical protein